MRSRPIGVNENPTKGTQVLTSHRGKKYVLCSDAQMASLRENQRQMILLDINDRGVQPTDEMVAAELAKWEEECGHITIDALLAMMTPDERKQWRDNYRFGAIFRNKPL